MKAFISLLQKVPLDCMSDQPISLLNVDFKLLSKMLTLQLESARPSIICTFKIVVVLKVAILSAYTSS